jgi:hypothetical protein
MFRLKNAAAYNHLTAVTGYSFLLCISIINIYQNYKTNDFFTFGAFMLVCAFSVGIYEKINDFKNAFLNKKMASEANIVYRHLILGTFQLLGFLFPINIIHRYTDAIAVVGHSILVTRPQNIFGNMCLMIFYFIQSFFDIMYYSDINSLISSTGNVFMFLFYFTFLFIQADKML